MTGSVLLPGAREREWSFGDEFEQHGSGLWLPQCDDYTTVPPPEMQPIGVDLFAGAGGFSCGFKQAGWHVAAASEGWAIAAITYLCNLGAPDTVVHLVGDELPEGTKKQSTWFREHNGESFSALEFFEACKGKQSDELPDDYTRPGSGWIASETGIQACEHFYLGDVRELTGEQILDDLGVYSDDVGCVFGGPPCQGFSLAGERKADDPRNDLVFEFMRVVIEVHPQAFCMENVPGIVSMVTAEGIPVLDGLAQMAAEGGMGTFEGIKRSLAATAGVGASLRGASSGKERITDTEDEDVVDGPEQLDLLGAAS